MPRRRLAAVPLEDRDAPARLVVPSDDTPQSIPLFEAIVSVIVVDDPGIVSDLNVSVHIDAPDTTTLIDVTLIGPDGDEIALAPSIQDTGVGGGPSRFTDEAAGRPPDLARFGTYRPGEPLATFDGRPAVGAWTLVVFAGAGADRPTLQEWSLSFDTGEPPPLGPPVVFRSTDTPRPITDFAQVRSPVTVTDPLNVAAIEVAVDITHPDVGQLFLNLDAPDGRTVTLAPTFFRRGPNFDGTLFSDAAGDELDDGEAPFTGRFRPADPLARLTGIDPRGDWQLRLTDLTFGTSGTLNNWSLRLLPAAPGPDLAADGLTADRTRADWGDTVNIGFTVANVGIAATEPTIVELALSTTPAASAGLPVGTAAVPALAPGQRFTGTIAVRLPDAPPRFFPPDGLFFLTLAADPDEAGADPDRGNNAPGRLRVSAVPLTVGRAESVEIGVSTRAGVALTPNEETLFPIDLTSEMRVEDLNVGLALTGDPSEPFTNVRLALIDPEGLRTPLSNAIWVGAGETLGMVLDDQAPRFGTRFVGREVARPMGPLDDLTGLPAAGRWQLAVTASAAVTVTAGWLEADTFVVLPDLAAVSLRSLTPVAGWGDPVELELEIINRGRAEAPAGVQVRLILSADGNIREDDSSFPFDEQIGTVTLPRLAPGETFRTTARVFLPVDVPSDFEGLPAVFVGLLIDSAQTLTEARLDNNGDLGLGITIVRLPLQSAVTEAEPNDTPATAQPIPEQAAVTGRVAIRGDIDWYELTLPDDGRLTVDVQPSGRSALDPRVQLYSADGQLLLQSDDRTAGATDAGFGQHLTAGVYRLRVSAQVPGVGGYRLVTGFAAASRPFDGVLLGGEDQAVADLNGDGVPDLIGWIPMPNSFFQESVLVALGNGDGTFAPPATVPLPVPTAALNEVITGVAAADLNGDGAIDLAVAVQAGFRIGPGFPPATVYVLQGRGDGSFRPARAFPLPGNAAGRIRAGDFDGDGKIDLAAVYSDGFEFGVAVLAGRGDGRFAPARGVLVGSFLVFDLVAADLDADGRPELLPFGSDRTVPVVRVTPDGPAVADRISLADADGFAPGARSAAVADLTGDGLPDLAVAGRNGVAGRAAAAVLIGRPGGGFSLPVPVGLDNAEVVVPVPGPNGRTDLGLVTSTGGFERLRFSGGRFVTVARGAVRVAPIDPFDPFQQDRRPVESAAVAELNGDSQPDIVINLGNRTAVLLSRPDGSLVGDPRFAAGGRPAALAVDDLDRDGVPDVVALSADSADGRVTAVVLLGRGDGALAAGGRVAVGDTPLDLALGDLNGDGRPDLVVADVGIEAPDTGEQTGGAIRVRLGRGDGGFVAETVYPLPGPSGALIGDVTGDGVPDVTTGVFAGFDADGEPVGRDLLVVLPGLGDGRLGPPVEYPVDGPGRIAAAPPGLPPALFVTTLGDRNRTLVFRPGPDGRLIADPPLPGTESFQFELIPADFNRDGLTDTLEYDATSIRVRLGTPDGGLTRERLLPRFLADYEIGQKSITVADFDRDGIPDLIISQRTSLLIQSGRGDGTFRDPVRLPVTGNAPGTVRVADADRDGRPDLFVAFTESDEIGVLLGGDGQRFRNSPGLDDRTDLRVTGQLLADLDGDGRDELVTVIGASSTLTPPQLVVQRLMADDTFTRVGVFELARTFPDGFGSLAAAGDVTGDGRPDLVFARGAGGFDLLPGTGGPDLFGRPLSYRMDPPATSISPPRLDLLSVAVLDGSGRADVVGLFEDNSGRIPLRKAMAFRFQPDGTFAPRTLVELPADFGFFLADDFTVTDVTGDGRAEVIDRIGVNSLTVYPNRGDGTFAAPVETSTPGDFFLTLGGSRYADVTGDGLPDRVVPRDDPLGILVMAGDGTGRFDPLTVLPRNENDGQAVLADLTGDGRLDILSITQNEDSRLYPNLGGGRFDAPRPLDDSRSPLSVIAQELALTGDLDGDGRTDLVFGYADETARTVRLAAGFTVTPTAADRSADRTPAPLFADLTGDGRDDALSVDGIGRATVRAGRADGTFAGPVPVGDGKRFADVAVVRTPDGPAVAAADAAGITLYRFRAGAFKPIGDRLPTGLGAVRLVAVDLNADGWDDLATANATDDSLTIYRTRADGGFDRADVLVGTTPADLSAADTDGDGRPELLAVGQYSADLSVVSMAGGSPELVGRYRVGTGLSGLAAPTGRPTPRALDQAVGLAVGAFDQRPGADVLAVLKASGTVVLLRGTAGGGFVDPPPGLGLAVGPDPTRPVVADFNRDGKTDFALLTRGDGTVRAWLGDGMGGFTPAPGLAAGPDTVGLTVRDADADGSPDLVLVNRFGDLLTAFNDGTGRFAPRNPSDAVPLAVRATAAGQADVLLANPTTDEVRVLARTGDAFRQTFTDASGKSEERPSAVRFADLNGDQQPDLVVANAGRNSVSVYLADGAGYRPPIELPAGAAPAGVTVADVSDDGVPDLLVANEGSNDVSVLLGVAVDGGGYTAVPGPRLRTGGTGPADVIARDQDGDGTLDLVVFNRQSGDFGVLAGVGGGFFDDRTPARYPLPVEPDPDDTTDTGSMPMTDEGTGTVVVGRPGGGVSVGSLPDLVPNTPGGSVFTPVAVPTGNAAVVSAQPVLLPVAGGGVGLVVGTDDGRFRLLGRDATGGFTTPLGAAAVTDRPGAIPSTAFAVPAGGGFELYVSFRGSSDPGLVRLLADRSPDVGFPPPPDGPSGGTPDRPDLPPLSVPDIPDIPIIAPGTTVPPPPPTGPTPTFNVIVDDTVVVIPTVGPEVRTARMMQATADMPADPSNPTDAGALADGGRPGEPGTDRTALADGDPTAAAATVGTNAGTGGGESAVAEAEEDDWVETLLDFNRALIDLGLIPAPKPPAEPAPIDPGPPPVEVPLEPPAAPDEPAESPGRVDPADENAPADSSGQWFTVLEAVLTGLGVWHRARPSVARVVRRREPPLGFDNWSLRGEQ